MFDAVKIFPNLPFQGKVHSRRSLDITKLDSHRLLPKPQT